MATQVAVTEEYGRNSMKKFVVHDTETPNTEARFAMALIEKWGMVAGEVDGEDSAGRSILRACTPAEVVVRACTIAEDSMAEFRKRGWMVASPDISELMRKTDD